MMTVLKPGMLSTFQDLGRSGWQHLGVPVSGAMDARAHRLANLLVGNDAHTATLEITLLGPQLRFDAPACFALAGADLTATLNGQAAALHRPLMARAGDVLAWGPRRQGVRAYLAMHGGWQLEHIMGSCATNLRSGFGGWHGRALAKGDVLPLRTTFATDKLDMLADVLWQQRIYLPGTLGLAPRRSLRILPGPHWQAFNAESQRALAQHPYRIGTASDRMGYRLEGPQLALTAPLQIISEGIGAGTVQVPADGAPIILMADRQTTGGYPKIAHVASVDLPQLAQLAPGEQLCFEIITLDAAQALHAQRQAAFARIAHDLQALHVLLKENTDLPPQQGARR